MKEETILINFRLLLKGWYMGKVKSDKLLAYILNYGLNDKFKDIDIEVSNSLK